MRRITALLIALAALMLLTAQAGATKETKKPKRHGKGHAVFVQTNEPSGNRIAVFARAANGTLTPAGTYATGGLGGVATPGTEPDPLASQGSLVYDAKHRLLIAVNAGSDTVTTFEVKGTTLRHRRILSSGGQFPASVAVSKKVAYVLNSGGTGIVQGFKIAGHKLKTLHGSARSLGLANSDPPDFLTSPGQVGFSPNGKKLIVTTKASGSDIDVFRVGHRGRLSATPVVNPSATPVPFAFTFQPGTGRLVVGEAATSTVTTYVVNGNGTIADPRSQSDGQTALCWIVRAGAYYYVSNTESNNLSGYTIGADGQPALVGATGIVANTAAGPIDMTVAGSYLYAQTGSGGTVHEYRVNGDGTLTEIGTVTGLPVGMEGIASS